MNREAALKKVLKCLRLAKSSNPNEAATALRHARRLMEEFGITESDAASAEYTEAISKTCARGTNVAPSIGLLINVIADGFRCESVAHVRRTSWGSPHSITVEFVGRGADPTIAAYAFDCMRRQLDRDRRNHIARVRKRANREARGEEFAWGWVLAVEHLFPAAELSEDESMALRAALEARHPVMQKLKPREMGKGGKVSENDFGAGWEAGEKARLHAGVTGEGQRRLGHD